MADLQYSYLGKPVVLLAAPLEEQVCQICGELVNSPQQLLCCGQDVCEGCLLNWLERAGTCPFCRERSPKYYPDVRNERAIKNLIGKCAFEEQGCNWKGELRDLANHLAECTKGIVPCPFRCGKKVPKGELDEHKGNYCTKRRYRCQYCGHEDTYDVITGDHFDTHCPRYPILCPNTCTAPSFPRCDLERHLTICPYQPVPCRFSDLGCSEQVIRSQMAEHCRDNMADHLNLACSMTVKLATKLDKLQKESQTGSHEDVKRMTVPLTFAVCWSKLAKCNLWLSPVFESSSSAVHKFQLRAAVSPPNSKQSTGTHTLDLNLILVEGAEPYWGKCSVSLVGLSSKKVDVSSSETFLDGLQFNPGKVMVHLTVRLNGVHEYHDMYGDGHSRSRDMLDSLFGDSDPIEDFSFIVRDDHFAVKVDIQPFVVTGWYTNNLEQSSQ